MLHINSTGGALSFITSLCLVVFRELERAGRGEVADSVWQAAKKELLDELSQRPAPVFESDSGRNRSRLRSRSRSRQTNLRA
jgi:hypothetical protein